MQEEIEQKSFNLMISTTKLSARTVLRAVKAAFRLYQSKASQGKQSVRTLLRQNRGVSSVEISKTGIRGLERYLRFAGLVQCTTQRHYRFVKVDILHLLQFGAHQPRGSRCPRAVFNKANPAVSESLCP